jgi:hypothetical protein
MSPVRGRTGRRSLKELRRCAGPYLPELPRPFQTRMSCSIRPVVERRGVACSYAIAHDEALKLLSEIAKRADAGETRRIEYGEVTAVVIEKGGQFLDMLSAGRKGMVKARQDELRPYHPSRAAMKLVDQLSRLATTWRQSIDPSDWSLRIYLDRRR